MVAVFPKLCLWRRSLRLNLGGIDPEKLYRATLSSFESAQTSSGTVSGHLIFGNDRKSSEICRKSSEVAGTFPEISVMTR